MYNTLPLFHHQAFFTQPTKWTNSQAHTKLDPIATTIPSSSSSSSLSSSSFPPILLYLFISTKFLVQILKSQSKLDPIATPSSSSLLHHSLFAPFHLIEPPHPVKLPPFTSTLYGHQQRNLIDGSHLETVPGDWCKTRADKSPPNRSTGSKIREEWEEGEGLVSTTANHGDLNRISFKPGSQPPRIAGVPAGLATMFAIEKPIPLISCILSDVHVGQFTPWSVYFSFLSFSLSPSFFFFSTVCHIFISRARYVAMCHCVCPLSDRAGFLIKSVSPLHGAPMETKGDSKYRANTGTIREGLVFRVVTVITNLVESRGHLLSRKTFLV